jgi:predicted HAD superfamily Cof-like phosphohydrolase
MSVSDVIKRTRLTNWWVASVADFQSSILRNEKPSVPGFNALTKQCADFLHEEATELADAEAAGDFPGTIDALVDLIYYAIGMSYQMGIDLTPFFYEVHLANMEKEHDPDAIPGVNKRVIKPAGWQEPRIAEIMEKLSDRS